MKNSKLKGFSIKPYAGRPYLLALFLVIETCIVLFFLQDFGRHADQYREQLLRAFDASYRGATTSFDYATQVIFDDEVNRPEILKLIAVAVDDDKKRDACRNELHRLMLPSFEKQKNIGISEFHFHLKDGTSFLRMRAPEQFGDNLNRRTAVYQVNKEQKPVKGYEVGYFSEGYRFVYPLFYNGRHVGSVEFGITSEGIINSLKKIYPAHYLFMIDRTIVDDMTYADWKTTNYRESGLSAYFVVGRKAAEDTTAASLNQMLGNKVRDRIAHMERFVEKGSLDGKNYLITFIPVQDVKGDAAAYFVQYINDDYLVHQSRNIILDITLFTLLLAGIYYTIDNVQARRRFLEQKNNELQLLTKTLHESEDRFKTLTESTSDWIWEVNENAIYTYASPKIKDLLGYDPKEVVGKTPFDLMPEEEVRRIKGIFSDIVKARRPIIRLENINVHKDGRLVMLETSGVPTFDAQGDFRGYRGIDRDITERTRMEKALFESERLYRTLFEQSVDAIFLLEAEGPESGRIIAANERALSMHGYCLEEMLQLNIRDLDVPEDAAKVEERLQRIKKEGLQFEVTHRRKDGSEFLVEVKACGVILGSRHYIMAIDADITERKKAEVALRESEEIFRSFMEYSPIYVFFKDEHIRSIRLSRNYEIMLERPIEELLGKTMDDLFPSDLAKSIIADDKRLMKEGTTISVEEEFNGRVYSTIKFPITIDGKPRYLAGYTIDITDRRKDERKIIKALQEKETLLREIHHRVKNNMQVVTSLLRLQAQKIQDKEQKKPFEESEQRIRAMALVHEKLYQKEDLSGINFSEYIHNIIRELQTAYSIDGARVSTKINVADVVLEIDSAIPCGLIINELITNCFKYAFPQGRSGEVTVNFIKDRSTYILTIRDNGIGLPAGFDYRQTPTLGMQIVNVLAKQLLGTFEISSDRGTEALITFSEKEPLGGKEENSDS